METNLEYKSAKKKYKKNFKKKRAKALEHALDIRKFEIELYWKRATYFWALIAVTFAGFFAVFSAKGFPDVSYKMIYVFIIANLGLFFSVAWFLVNKGSKYWQENWENHVNMLEDKVIGPLYKVTLERPQESFFSKGIITSPAKLSVSKINQWVSFFTIIVWLGLIVSVFDWSFQQPYFIYQVVIFIIVLFFLLFLYLGSKSHTEKHYHVYNKRKAYVIKKRD